MPNYRRPILCGGIFFFTVVTLKRRPFLIEPPARAALQQAFDLTRAHYPFQIDAICLLPDHIHCIWTLPEGVSDFSIRWRAVKGHFSRIYHLSGGTDADLGPSRKKRGESGFWQRRFWEHAIRDEADYRAHLDYIHYNPVKHGLVKNGIDWPWSSFHRMVNEGIYSKDWGWDAPISAVGE